MQIIPLAFALTPLFKRAEKSILYPKTKGHTMEKSKNINVLRLTETALMLALAVILNELTSFSLPFGGSYTLFSQLPIIIIAYRYGIKWGLTTSFLLGFVQLLFGLSYMAFLAKSISAYLIFILADYIVAFGVLGFGGIFRGKIKNQGIAMAVGGIITSIVRYICHVISGVTIWSAYAENTPVLIYSLTYNSFMLVELIMTAVGAVLISLVLNFKTRDITIRKRSKA